jgi:3-hydroxybutyryl-CoA dehydrogenase
MVIRTIGVVGSGTMGTGIALVCARAGFQTIVLDQDEASLERARTQAEAFLEKSVARGKLTEAQVETILGNWQATSKISKLSDCDLIIEAIFEDLNVKHALFQQLDEVCGDHTIFASNTSTISITEIAGGSGRADRFVGMHFCLPAQLMKLVEMSPGLNTSEATWQTAWDACTALGQSPVRTQDTPGFILNYFLIPYHNDAIRLIEQDVAEAAEIDKAMKAAMGYPMGPFELLDLVGADTQKLLCEAMHGLTYEKRAACPPLVRRMIAAGHLGKKSGKGFHDYSDAKIFGA